MNTQRLPDFIHALTTLIEHAGNDEATILADGGPLLHALVSHDDWLPEALGRSHPDHYQQYMLHCDPSKRFTVVSFVWGPGQETPIHDHTVWGMIGILRGAETNERFDRDAGRKLFPQGSEILRPGDIDCLSPRIGDLHRVANAYTDRDSISIHVYGADIGNIERHTYDPKTGQPRTFVSGYSTPPV